MYAHIRVAPLGASASEEGASYLLLHSVEVVEMRIRSDL